MADSYEKELKQWVDSERTTLELQHTASKLLLERDIELVLFRRKFFDKKLSEIMHDHSYLSQFAEISLSTALSKSLANAIAKLEVVPSKIDLGRLSREYHAEGKNYGSVEEFVKAKLGELTGAAKKTLVPRDIVLYGFGRIGRLAARILMDHAGSGHQLRLKGIVTRDKSTDDLPKACQSAS
jgi:glyceraldehyde 3-phosphate dehydrogenase